MKPVKRNIDEQKIKVILSTERSMALGSTSSSDLSEQRMRAFNYYMGDVSQDIPNEKGLSNAVSSDVQDIVDGALPILLDVLTSSNNVVEFKAEREGDEDAAAQETQYVNHVFFQENNGFLTLHNAVKDALLSKNCFVKWWMEPDEARTREKYQGLPQAALAMILADTEVDVVDIAKYTQPDPDTQQPVEFFDVVTERTEKKLRPRVAAFPPEEWLISRNARTIPDAPYLAHVQLKAQADLIGLFPEKEAVIRSAPAATLTSDNGEALNRQTVQDNQDQLQTSSDVNTDMRQIEATEHYIRLALEDDKVARRYKITTVGEKAEILDIEEISAWPVASGTAIIMPHRVIGRSLADLAIDVMQMKTSLLRATLNNAYFANNSRTEVSETHASENTIDDLLNNRVGGIVRTRMPGGIKPIETQSIGGWTSNIIEYLDGVVEKRSGVSKSNTGLDVDSMNHARTGAVSRIMDASEMRLKLMARILAETLLTDMFRGIHGMLQEYSEAQEVFELNGKWIQVDPREWTRRRHMKVSLPLGGIGRQQMLGFFAQLLTVQQAALEKQGGPNGPLVSYEGIYSTLDQMTKLAGLTGAAPYFMKPAPPNPNAPPPPDPRMVEAQANAAATQAETQAKNQLAQQQFQHETQMETMKLQAQRAREQDEFSHKAALDKAKFEHEAEMERLKTGFQLRLEAFKAEETIKINREQAKEQAKPGVGEV